MVGTEIWEFPPQEEMTLSDMRTVKVAVCFHFKVILYDTRIKEPPLQSVCAPVYYLHKSVLCTGRCTDYRGCLRPVSCLASCERSCPGSCRDPVAELGMDPCFPNSRPHASSPNHLLVATH